MIKDRINQFRQAAEFRTLCLTVLAGIFLAASFFKLFSAWPFDPAWIAIVISGVPIVGGAIKGLIREFDVTADVLVAIALIAAVMIGEYFAAGEVAFIMQLGKILEDYTAGKSQQSLQTLLKLTPQKACRRTATGDQEILAAEVHVHDVLLVRPGEAIPVDGRIVRGSTSVDQAVMTGESVPVDKETGDEVYQGTINQQGAIEIEAMNNGEDSSLQKMIRLVKEAAENKAPIVRIADKWARILVPVALGCAVLIWILTGNMNRAVTALVVFCPCALILATPTAMMAAIGNATKKGILIKSGAAVEAVAKLDTLVLDKTGTLTYGKLQVEAIYLPDQGMQERKMKRDDFISLVASAEKFSEHPLGKAITEYAQRLNLPVHDPEHFETQTGKGIAATIAGHPVLIGEKVIGSESVGQNPEAMAFIAQKQEQGKTVLPCFIDGKPAGIIAIADALRQEAAAVIVELKKAGLSRIIMLTGDKQAVADSIGKAAGVTAVYASRLPEDKVSVIKSLAEQGFSAGMLGDGVNDAPALAAAVGIVMGAMGSDAAIEAADIALMQDDLRKLPFLMRICRKTKKRIVTNIVISMVINFGAIMLAGLGMLNPVTAALVHNCGSVFVVINSALLLTYNEQDQLVVS
jgi:Cu+-exporting ATPase